MAEIEHNAPERVFVVMLRDGRTDHARPAEGAHQFSSEVEYVRADQLKGAVEALTKIRDGLRGYVTHGGVADLSADEVFEIAEEAADEFGTALAPPRQELTNEETR